MAIFINDGDVTNPNNVGQFGATEESIGAYKQAGEYAQDAEYWAKLSEKNINTIDDLLVVVEELLKQGVMLEKDIEDLKADFAAQDARLTQLISQTNAAVDDANNAIDAMNAKLIEVQKQLDVLLAMYVTVETLPAGTPATGTFDATTGEFHFGIPEGAPGSVTDLNNAPTGVPDANDWGFYVESTDNTVHKALMTDIAKTFPSVTSVTVGSGTKETGDVTITSAKLGLGNVLNVPSYSKTESDAISTGYVKTYESKADADDDAKNRKVGESVLVWNDLTYDFYDVIAGATGQPNKLSASTTKTEKRIITVNLKEPDSTGNIDITVPTGNPSLYLGEMLLFPYDPNKPIAYQGIKPADGSLISKADAADLGPSLVSGQLPVVSETEWQAGAKHYFSWGKLSDGTTDADATNYINIRLPDWTDGTAMRSPSTDGDVSYAGQEQVQIPYITMVNGVAPADADGKVVIPFSSFTDTIMNNNVALQGKDNSGYGKDLIKMDTSNNTLVGDGTTPVVLKGTTVSVSDGTNTGKIYSEINKPSLTDLGAAKSGANSDITSMSALTSVASSVNFALSPTIPDPVNPSDAVTKRYVDNNSGGGSGATLNGIMNYGVGTPYQVMSRALIRPTELPLDGQTVSRTTYPDLWTYAQAVGLETEVNWLADPLKRGKFTAGDGSTTFRVPDWNGVVKNGTGGATGDSRLGLFARGDGGVSSNDGKIVENGAPNIAGQIYPVIPGVMALAMESPSGAFTTVSAAPSLSALTGATSSSLARGIDFSASRSNAAYGRNSTTEVVPNHVISVWVIRATGGFTAANTSWSVINADSTAPANGTTVKGGAVRSSYKVGTTEQAAAELKTSLSVSSSGVKTVGAEVNVVDSTGGTAVSKVIKLGTVDGLTGGTVSSSIKVTGTVVSVAGTAVNAGGLLQCEIQDQNSTIIRSRILTELNTGSYSQTTIANFDGGRSEPSAQNQYWAFRSDGNAYANGTWTNGASDIRVKKDFEEIKDPFATMRKIRAGTWRMNTKTGDGKFGIGVLANGLYDDYPEAKLTNGDQELVDGTIVKDVLTVQSGDSGVLAAVHHASILKLMDKIAQLESRISELESK